MAGNNTSRRNVLRWGGAWLGGAWLASPLMPAVAQPTFRGQIRLGQTMPYSGPASALSALGKVQARYFRMVNERGGIHGREVVLLSLDDGYNPARAVEQTRKLVEQERVLAMFASMGTAQNAAVQKYLNGRKVPQLFVYAGSGRFADPAQYPWTLPGMTTFPTEAAIYADYIHRVKPGAKVVVLYQNDDFGKEYLAAFRRRLQETKSAVRVDMALTYEVTTPTVDSQVISLAASRADVFLNITSPKFTIQAIRKAHDLGWKPLQFVPITSNFIATVLKPAGLDRCEGLISATPAKAVGDAEWQDDAGYRDWLAFMQRYYPEGDVTEQLNLTGYNIAVLMEKVLRDCGDDLTPARLLRQATTLQDVALPGLIPGITVSTSPQDYRIIRQLRLQRFDGTRWVRMA